MKLVISVNKNVETLVYDISMNCFYVFLIIKKNTSLKIFFTNKVNKFLVKIME
jgi:hypothetical protein